MTSEEVVQRVAKIKYRRLMSKHDDFARAYADLQWCIARVRAGRQTCYATYSLMRFCKRTTSGLNITANKVYLDYA